MYTQRFYKIQEVSTMENLSQTFGSMVFGDSTMRERLPKETYKALKKTIQDGNTLDLSVANIVANAMKDWAIEKGATHFTHWFQPMTGITAEKHDSFISPTMDGAIIMEFSGKELIKGEPDASSFPSGGLRSTFEARGYTAWDPTSYAFVKDKVLCIPTAFCSYSGEALDKKTPLLRSMEALNTQAMRILSLFGHTNVSRVLSTVGPEQEYFLINKGLYDQRKDIIYTGRTLFGAKPPKGQELEDHYFGVIKPKISLFMQDLNDELWKLGIFAKTEHNEVSPAQHELAPVFTTTNIATDHNQITMEIMKKVAQRHGLECLLHEKPFAGVNGSGKHNNWSISTNTGVNLLEPGETPQDNMQFLLFLAAIIKAVDEHQDMLRVAIASAGNDHRLGANEAPPAIISVFLGEQLTDILEAIEEGKSYIQKSDCTFQIGVNCLPSFPKDTTDRNRTSPFAFTGNKFEFRMLGSSISISGPNVVLNTIVADALSQYADVLEKSSDLKAGVMKLVKETVQKHKRIIFNGNNYAEEWVTEAKKRGLLNLQSMPDAMPYFIMKKNVDMFSKLGVFTEGEIHSRYEILLDAYCKTLNIEALTMLEMAKRDILPAVGDYERDLARTASFKKELGLDNELEKTLITKLTSLATCLMQNIDALDNTLIEVKKYTDILEISKYYRNGVFVAMQELRAVADSLEMIVGKKYWPYPNYGDLLLNV
jgi:glutamine synthetase